MNTIPSVTPFFQPPDMVSPLLASASAKLSTPSVALTIHILPYVLLAISLASLTVAIYLFSQLIKHYLELPTVILEVTPPHNAQQSAFSTQQLFTTLHSLGLQTSWWHCFLGRKKLYTLELVATRNDGIRFCMRVPTHEADVIKKTLRAYLPGVIIREVTEYLPSYQDMGGMWNIITFRLFNHYGLPLQKHTMLSQHDPIAYITTHMTKLEKDELVVYQVIATPIVNHIHSKIVKKIQTIDAYIHQGFDISSLLVERNFLLEVLFGMLRFVFALFVFGATFPLGMFEAVTRDHRDKSPMLFPVWIYTPKKLKRNHELSPQQQYIQKMVSEKIGQELFEASMRVLLIQNTKLGLQSRGKGFATSLSPFNNEGYQGLRLKRYVLFMNKFSLFWKYSYFLFHHRLLGFKVSNNAILTTTELSDLYHFPYFGTTQTEDMIHSKTHLLPAPLSQKQTTTILDVTVGKNTFGETETVVGLTRQDRQKHTYIVGKSGMGKSTIMKYLAYQDIVNGKGIGVIDPHGDMVQELLSVIPKSRKKDVVYIDVSDKSYPIGLNILAPGMAFKDSDEEQEWVNSTVLSIFMKITPKEHWGQRMEHILRNATLSALQTNNEHPLPYLSLFTIQKLLTDEKFQKTVSTFLSDPILKQFWTKEYALFGKMQQGAAISPLTNKLGEFMTSKLSRNILLQEHTTLPLSKLMDEGKIILINLSKGKLGEERSAFFGTLFTALFQLACYQRAYIPEKKRRDFYLYIDEFQNFASPLFADLFSEARKFHMFITLSHQTLAQLDDMKLTNVLLGNTGNLIALATGVYDEEKLLPHFGSKVTKGDIVNLPPHHFIMKVHNDAVDDAFTGETIVLEKKENIKTVQEIINQTQQQYATPQSAVEEQLRILFGIQSKPNKTKGPKKNTYSQEMR